MNVNIVQGYINDLLLSPHSLECKSFNQVMHVFSTFIYSKKSSYLIKKYPMIYITKIQSCLSI